MAIENFTPGVGRRQAHAADIRAPSARVSRSCRTGASRKPAHGVQQWYSNTLLSRLDDKVNGVIILVMQRLHVDDLAGYLMQ